MYLFTAIGFALLTIVSYGVFFRHVFHAITQTNWTGSRKKKVTYGFSIGFILWIGFLAAITYSGFAGNFENFPFNVMPVVAIPLITSLVLIFSSSTKQVITHLPFKMLTQLQVFRVFVELLLWLLYIQNLLPVQMTFEGRNWDIVVGITSLVIAAFFLTKKSAMIVWNIFGMILLVNIVTIAILSLPSPIRVFHNEPANTIVTVFPFVLLPGLLVPFAYILHFLSFRKLLMKP